MAHEVVGIIAFAFGQDGDHLFPKSGPANDIVVKRAEQIRTIERNKNNRVFMAVQWEGACSQWLDHSQQASTVRVSEWGPHHKSPTHYVTTEQVLDTALRYFRAHDVTRVIFVAQGFHLFAINYLLKSDEWKRGLNGLELDTQYTHKRGLVRIPYDDSHGNIQWWTRGPLRFATYLVRAKFTNHHGS